MVNLGSVQLLPAVLVALALVPAARAATDTLDFSFYPPKSQDCLYEAAERSQCESGTVIATNACFCRNGGQFVTRVAECVGRSARDDLEDVYETMSDACRVSQTPMTISEDEFMEAADAGQSTTTTRFTRTRTSTAGTEPTSGAATESTAGAGASSTGTDTSTVTTTVTANPTSAGADGQDDTGSDGLTTGAMAGIIAGAIGGSAVLGAIVFILLRQRKKGGEESHPMLPQHASLVATGHESTAYFGSSPDTGVWPKKDWGGASPDVRSSMFNWESPAHLSYPGGALAPSPPLPVPAPVQELDGAQHFPPGSAQAPAEMGGTPVDAAPPPSWPAHAQLYHQPYSAQQQQYGGSAWSPQHR